MRVKDVMTREVVTARPETTLKEVARLLAEHRISGMPVVDEDGKILGVVSEADILAKERGPSRRRGVLAWLVDAYGGEEKLKLEARTAGEAMTSPAKTIAPWRPVWAAAEIMLDAGINRLPVADDEGRLVGIVTRADLVRAFVRPDAEIEREIREDVLVKTLWLRDADAVNVAVENGKVTLTGTVDTRRDAELIRLFVARTPGVVEVRSAITWRRDGDT
ncbi:MAG TPA: CBS domain-containing protein [Gaiellaceae bacterium]|nr:CBS domain-containing protein [Gaiellaceae bacterium]